ncbi:hypothetical protein Ccrd_017196 [Cynara cardunculus var. scolymus]|uniref:GDT1 family protein n=1 Tax=Cynara cardunculus var. scolymus TaxID=59895 RepID=A0A103Y8I6_CYNCS|nr:hypothetical protein Ccrd_017196 [Cynara cardunculus var. scolymus]
MDLIAMVENGKYDRPATQAVIFGWNGHEDPVSAPSPFLDLRLSYRHSWKIMKRGTAWVLLVLFVFVFVAASRVSAKDLFVEDDDAESTGSIIDLGRRSKVSTLSLATPIVARLLCSPMPEPLETNGMLLGNVVKMRLTVLLMGFVIIEVLGVHNDEDDSQVVVFMACKLILNLRMWNLMVVVAKLKNNVIGDKIDPKAVLNLDSGLGVFDAFFASLSMILVSEIGDETFIIAALMAMRHPKSIVLSGALSALFVMTILSTGLGRIVPNLISRKHTNSAATGIAVLYAFFGLRLLYIAWRSDSKASQKKEMEEVEEKLESGQGKTAVRRFFSRFCTPIFLESFILTFLAEWGDRSQIATIALATHKNAVGVAIGATLGHTICTSVAVIGGSMLASKISQRTVATVGGLLFLGFSVSSYFYPPL